MKTATSRVLFGALLIATALSAQDGPRGHWTGSIDVPGHVAAVEVDLDRTAKGWVGSMAVPSQKASGIPLEAISFTNGEWTFRIKGLPEAPTFTGTLSADGLTLSGDFTQGGESFPFKLSRAGDARVEEIKPSPAVAKEFLGTWEGTLVEAGRPKRTVLKLANDECGASAVLISPDEGAEIPVASIEQKDAELKLSVKALGGEYWGEINKDGTELSGSWTQSGNNLPLKFKKKGGELAPAAPAPAPTPVTVEQLKQFIHSSSARKDADQTVVNQLKTMTVAERISGQALRELLSESPGALTSEALKQLQTAAQNLPLPAAERRQPERKQAEQQQAEPQPSPPSKPLSAEQEKIVAEAREIALDYTRRLPDFICLQFTRRYEDALAVNDFHLKDTVAAQLTYFGQKEEYKVISRKENYRVAPKNDKGTGSSNTSLDGAVSGGEFGTLLRQIFEPETHAEFWFQRRTSVHRQLTLVFSYRVLATNSRWIIEYSETGANDPGALVYRPAYTGALFIDPETHAVLRVSMEAQSIPLAFPIQGAKIQLDYAYQDLAGQKFLLPAIAVVNMREGRLIKKNEIEFRNYRKYSAASDISFEADSAGAINEEKEKDKQLSTPPR